MTLKSKTFNRRYLDLKVCPWSVKPCYCNASWDRLPPTQCWAVSAGERTTELALWTSSWTSTHFFSYWLLYSPFNFPFPVNANISLECRDNSECNSKNHISRLSWGKWLKIKCFNCIWYCKFYICIFLQSNVKVLHKLIFESS